jgi:serine/threonine protein kinase
VSSRCLHRYRFCDDTYGLFRIETSYGELLFLTMKLLRGEPLSARLSRLGAVPAENALAIAVQMAAALDAAHQSGVIHRDFKPGNVMLELSAPIPHVYITDFALSRAFEADGTLAQTGRISGTLGYIAPELLQGRIAGPASDVYAFGVVLHEMLTGEKPKNKPGQAEFLRPSSLKPGLSRAWDRVILGCLAYDPARRFQSAAKHCRRWIVVAAPAVASPQLRFRTAWDADHPTNDPTRARHRCFVSGPGRNEAAANLNSW